MIGRSESPSFFMHRRHLRWFALPLLACAGCVHVKLDPIQVHAVVDVNVKVDRALTDFFGDLDQKSSVIHTPPSTN